jgi:mRNA-degrading endonuclease toxin of MazEF toxin-antitoxin module
VANAQTGVDFSIIRRGQIYRFPAEVVTANLGTDIGARWYIVVQSDEMNNNPQKVLFVVARITGRENIKKDYPWQFNIDRAKYGFLDKDSTVLGANLYTFERSDFKRDFYAGQIDDNDLTILSVVLKRALGIP